MAVSTVVSVIVDWLRYVARQRHAMFHLSDWIGNLSMRTFLFHVHASQSSSSALVPPAPRFVHNRRTYARTHVRYAHKLSSGPGGRRRTSDDAHVAARKLQRLSPPAVCRLASDGTGGTATSRLGCTMHDVGRLETASGRATASQPLNHTTTLKSYHLAWYVQTISHQNPGVGLTLADISLPCARRSRDDHIPPFAPVTRRSEVIEEVGLHSFVALRGRAAAVRLPPALGPLALRLAVCAIPLAGIPLRI
ncbi:hypothetical protein ONZ51_g13511 [Trametes cubensis]|uniref:Uncharacterized protein n=1 Tax=Trametes cubensis TaxID=1111947 RepID=A0AAD7TE30_9APHY|nr:hypothetical protein ONZ51_g13511 [Trametes cubensis]